MPVVTFHLVEGAHDRAAVGQLLRRSCELFADVLDSPIERVRAFASESPAHAMCVGGQLVSDGGAEAPFFQFYLLEGRPQEQHDRLLTGFTELLVDVLGVERSRIRGAVVRVAPQDWTIGGRSAAAVRADEIAARADTA
jgi:4-oxalocrotonate tautomerase family enzyme